MNTAKELVKLKSAMNEQFGFANKRFEKIDQRFEQVDRRFESLEKELKKEFNSKIDHQTYQMKIMFEQMQKTIKDTLLPTHAILGLEVKSSNHDERISKLENETDIIKKVLKKRDL